ncbi:MAG: sensor histidine kinase [Terriglobia bacterium]
MDEQCLRVLLVEDNPGDARLVEMGLAEAGPQRFQVERAERLVAANNRLRAGTFDVVLLDLSLPDSQGIDTLKRVRTQNREVPIVVLTGLSDEQIALQALHAGAQDYLVKGTASPATLTRVIRYAIQRQQLARLKAEFLALVSHELRTPLAVLQESVNLILDGLAGRFDEGVKVCLVMAQGNIVRLGAIVNDLLDMATLEAGRLKLTKETENICSLVADSLQSFQGRAGGMQVQLSLETGRNGAQYARVDRYRILQVLTNLLGNALKFVQPGEGMVQARVLRDHDWIRVEIADNGRGIKQEDQERIFQRFAQAEGAEPGLPRGTGLGLAIAKEIVELHGGRIGVSSEYGKGSTFFFLLPTATPRASAENVREVIAHG